MKSNKSVKAMIATVTSKKLGIHCDWNNEGALIAYEGDGYAEWQEVFYYEPVSLDASGNIQAVSKG